MERKPRILVVDDDPVIRQQHALLLATEGYEVSEAATGTEGLAVFSEKHPELVLLDVHLPDMDGRDVCQGMKADTSRPDPCIILVSNEVTSGSDKALGLEKGADDFLLKRVNSAELVARVKTHLRLHQATDALRASEQYYRRLIEILPDAVLLVNLQGRLLHANPQAVAMLGGSDQSELMETNVLNLVHPDQRERFGALLGKTLASQFIRNQEFDLLKESGQPFPVEISTASLETSQGHALTLVLVVRDVSFRKDAEAALAKGKSLRKAILDNISEPAWLKDTEGRFLACNQAMANFYGKKVEELIGSTVFELPMPAQVAKELTKEDQAVMRSGQPGRFEGERISSQGEHKWFESVKSPLFAQNGECIGTVGIARDTTQRRRLEQELRLLSRRIIEAQEAERFRVARELHDSVNQLLASVQMRIRRIEQGLIHVKPSAREILARCHAQIILALQENRRIAHGLRPSDLDELGLAISCRNYCREFRSRTNLKLRFLIKGLSERLPRDTELNLFRIVQEAFANVEKHAQAKEVRLSIVRSKGVLHLKVQDDGRGFIPKHSASRSRSKGGIGLTNMKERAAYLNGTCEIITTPGKGTIVSVRIPLEKRGREVT
jgi:PAS domain S-box-containing protein